MVELEPEAAEDLGRLDIAFLPTGLDGAPDEAIYFCVECKRLNVVDNGQLRPGGSDYVRFGMLRFVSGQYARAVSNGGMLGYVLDGRVTNAIANVGANIEAHCTPLCMDPPGQMEKSGLLPDEQNAKQSLHRRKNGAELFRIHHLFVDASSKPRH
jgi:hypothetical protein